MFIKSVMIPKYQCVIVEHDTPLEKTLSILEENNIDGAPVLRGQNFVGIITRFRIYEGYFTSSATKEAYLKETSAEEIARKRYLLLNEDDVFEHAFILLKNNPVAGVQNEEGHFLGIVTRYDMFEEFTNSLGVKKEGVRLTLTSVECEGRIALLTDIATHYHVNIISLATFDATDKLVRRIVMKVENNERLDAFLDKIVKAGFKIVHKTGEKMAIPM